MVSIEISRKSNMKAITILFLFIVSLFSIFNCNHLDNSTNNECESICFALYLNARDQCGVDNVCRQNSFSIYPLCVSVRCKD